MAKACLFVLLFLWKLFAPHSRASTALGITIPSVVEEVGACLCGQQLYQGKGDMGGEIRGKYTVNEMDKGVWVWRRIKGKGD